MGQFTGNLYIWWILMVKTHGFPVDFPLKPIHWATEFCTWVLPGVHFSVGSIWIDAGACLAHGSARVPVKSAPFEGFLVCGLEHFLFFHILGIIIPTDELIFSEGLKPPIRFCSVLRQGSAISAAQSALQLFLRTWDARCACCHFGEIYGNITMEYHGYPLVN